MAEKRTKPYQYKDYPESQRDYENFLYPYKYGVHPIDPKKEPLLASLDRLNLFVPGEKEYFQAIDPQKTDAMVIRSVGEKDITEIHNITGQQLRDAYAIATAYVALTKNAQDPTQPALDAEAKDALVKAIKAYPIHTYDNGGNPIPGKSRVGKDGLESLKQVLDDTKGFDRHQHTYHKMFEKYDGRVPKTKLGEQIWKADAEKAKRAAEAKQTPKSNDGANKNVDTKDKTSMNIPEGVKNLEDIRLIANQLNKAMNSVASTGSDLDAKALSLLNEDVIENKKIAI